MHRHGYQGKKFGRQAGPRKALIRSLAESLVLNESVETTSPKAKELSRYMEKLITKAKHGDLHSRRQVRSGLFTVAATHKLVDELAPKMSGRTSGHLRIKTTTERQGDGAQLARVSFVDDLTVKVEPKPAPKAAAKKTPAKVDKPKPKAKNAKKTGVKK